MLQDLEQDINIELKYPLSTCTHRLHQFYHDHDLSGFSSYVNEKRYTINDTGNTYKVINDWTRLEIIDDSRDSDRKWRKFSLADLVWIRIVSYLRSFNYPLSKIRELKKDVFSETVFYSDDKHHVSDYVKIEGVKYPKFEFNILAAYLFELPFEVPFGYSAKLIVMPDNYSIEEDDKGNKIRVETEAGLFFSPAELGRFTTNFVSFICVDIAKLVDDIILDSGFTGSIEDKDLLEDNEGEFKRLINTVNTFGPFESLNVKYKDGKMEMVEIGQRVEQSKIGDLLKNSAFQDIEIKQENGVVQYVKRKIKKKL